MSHTEYMGIASERDLKLETDGAERPEVRDEGESMITPISLASLTKDQVGDLRIVSMTEVYKKNAAGTSHACVGFFDNETVAEAYIEGETNRNLGTRKVFAARSPDGKFAYRVMETPEKLFDSVKEKLRIVEKFVSNISPSMRKLLGLEDISNLNQ